MQSKPALAKRFVAAAIALLTVAFVSPAQAVTYGENVSGRSAYFTGADFSETTPDTFELSEAVSASRFTFGREGHVSPGDAVLEFDRLVITALGEARTIQFWFWRLGVNEVRVLEPGVEFDVLSIFAPHHHLYFADSVQIISSLGPSGVGGNNPPRPPHLKLVSATLFRTQALPVPEPSTWALMIGGFCAAGAMLRRRRGVAVAAPTA